MIALTAFRADGSLGKIWHRDAEGKVTKEIRATLDAGQFARKEFLSAADLAAYVRQLGADVALTFGVPRDGLVRGDVVLKHERHVNGHPIIARCSEDIRYPVGPGVLFVDIDADHYRAVEPLEARGDLIEIFPALARAPMVAVASQSSFIWDSVAEQWAQGKRGAHLYVIVSKGADVPELSRRLIDRLWLAGQMHYAPSSSGTRLTRGLIDVTMYQAERFAFSARPECRDGLECRRPDPAVFNTDAEPLRLEDVPPLTAEESLRLAAIKRAAKEAFDTDPEVRRRRDELRSRIAGRLQAIGRRDIGEQALRQAIERLELPPSWPITLDDGTETSIAELLKDPARWHESRMRDPLEPDYRDDHRCAVFLADGTQPPTIYSWAHGGILYRIAPVEAPSVWAPPLDIFRDIIAAPFSLDDVPAPVATFAEAVSASTGFDRSAAIVVAVAAAAAVIDDRYRLAVRHGSGWFESARLWVALIGGPSAGKSPTIRAATDPIKKLHREAWTRWTKENADKKPEERDPEPCLYTSDATLEALSDVLKGNPRGVLMLTEEFASWIGSIDAYRNGQGSRDRGEMLQLYDGGPHQVHRVKRGSFLVDNWGASVIAAGTPAGLRQQIKQLPDDGLIHRFIPVIMQRPGNASATSIKDPLADWERTLRGLYTSTTMDETARRARLTPEASAVFEAEVAKLREVTADTESLAPPLASHLGKHAGMIARVALVFHLLRQERSEGIAASTMEMACRFMRTARRHAAALFLDVLQTSSTRDLARALGRSLAAGAPPAQVNRAWFTNRCRSFRDADDQQRRSAVEFIEDAGWLRPVTDSRPYGGWAATAWEVNPGVFERFAGVGDEHRRRRENVRAAVMGEAK